MSDLDRTSKEYLKEAVGRIPGKYMVFGIQSDVIPETYEQLVDAANAVRGDEGSKRSEGIEKFLTFLALFPNRDELVAQLPATGEEIALVMPSTDYYL